MDGEILKTKIGSLPKARKDWSPSPLITLEHPGLLILDEPTNHINFRHIPVIAQALDRYEGAMILVSHVPDFVKQIRIDYTLNLADFNLRLKSEMVDLRGISYLPDVPITLVDPTGFEPVTSSLQTRRSTN